MNNIFLNNFFQHWNEIDWIFFYNENSFVQEEKINEIIAEGGTVVKMEVDYSSTCDEKLPQAESLAAAGKLTEAMDILTGLEKQCRTGSDTHSNGRVLVLTVRLCMQVFTVLSLFHKNKTIEWPRQYYSTESHISF